MEKASFQLNQDPLTLGVYFRAHNAMRAASEQNHVRIDLLKRYLEAYLLVYSTEEDGAFVFRSDSSTVRLSWNDMTLLINTVISLYLQMWGTNNQNLHQSISQFLRHPYSHREDSSEIYDAKPEPSMLKVLHRIEQKYLQIMELRKIQINKANKDKKPTLIEEPQEKLYNILSLSWIQHFSRGHLRHQELMFYKKEFLTVTNEKEEYKALADACLSYKDGLKYIHDLYSTAGDPSRNSKQSLEIIRELREYVSLSLMIIWLERGSRFQLASEIAQYLTEQNFQEISLATDAAKSFWATMPPESKTDETKYPAADTALDILSYKTQIPYAFGSHTPEALDYKTKVEVMRRLAQDMEAALYNICPPNQQRLWTRQDLQEIADFFHKDYPVVAQYFAFQYPPYESPYQELQEDQVRRRRKEGTNPFYSYLYQVYEYLLNQEDSPTAFAREILRKQKGNQDE